MRAKNSQEADTKGHPHPISSLMSEAVRIFGNMGFTVAEGPLVEDEWHNFDSLNVPKNHPARDMQDTFFLKDEEGMVLRTHTSPVQMRYMESRIKKGVQPPYRIIVPGGAFRNEATDMTHKKRSSVRSKDSQSVPISASVISKGLSRPFSKNFWRCVGRDQVSTEFSLLRSRR